MKRLLPVALTALMALPAGAQVTVGSAMDSIQILIGQQTDLTLSVTARRGARVEMPEFGPRDTIIHGIEVVECLPLDTVPAGDGMVTTTRKYRLTSFDEDMYYIPAMEVMVDGKAYRGREMALKVLTVEVDTLHPENFFPPKDVQDNPFLWDEWKPLFRMAVALVLLTLAALYLLLRLRQNKPILAVARIMRRVPPHERAMERIERIKREGLGSGGDQKEYYTQLTEALRRYIEERFGFSAMEMTSGEIIARLEALGDRRMMDELRSLFATADLVKFAKASALVNENDANLVSAIEFINTTKEEGAPVEERIEPELTRADIRSRRERRALEVTVAALLAACLCMLLYVLYRSLVLLGL